MIEEGSVKLDLELPKKVSKSLPVFYNPVMKLNRDVSIEIVNNYFDTPPRVALPLSGSGIRGMRFLKECNVKEVYFNDYMDGFENKIKNNLNFNDIKSGFIISNKDANIFLLDSKGFDYIDVDPFGTPNPFLDSAVQRIARNGVLAVTATDTSALAGTYPSVCFRNYDARPLRNWLKHFVGLRILIRKVQVVGAQYEKALYPVLSYSKDHYYRIFFRCVKSKEKATEIVKNHSYLVYDDENVSYKFSNDEVGYGKMYSGPLWEVGTSHIKYVNDEMSFEGNYFDVHYFCEKLKLTIPPFAYIFEKLISLGFKVSRSHFSLHYIKTDASSDVLKKIISNYR